MRKNGEEQRTNQTDEDRKAAGNARATKISNLVGPYLRKTALVKKRTQRQRDPANRKSPAHCPRMAESLGFEISIWAMTPMV